LFTLFEKLTIQDSGQFVDSDGSKIEF
jgi:hypothetical protein